MRPDIIAAMSAGGLLGDYFAGTTWDPWRCVLKGAAGLGATMSDSERVFFETIAGRAPPRQRARVLAIIAGRRSGKDSAMSGVAALTAATFEPRGRTRPGERPVVMMMAADREQAKSLLGYTKGYFSSIPALGALVQRETAGVLELSTGVDLVVTTSDYRLVRGRSVLLAILNEISFWPQDGSASPDVETVRALMPGMATLADEATLVAISSAHRRQGWLYSQWEQHYGREGDVLVVHARTDQLNPSIDPALIAAEMAADPQSAAAEYSSIWRDDLSGYVTRDEVVACVDSGIAVRPPVRGVNYTGFIDASSGRDDSFTAAIASREGEIGILHCAIEIPAPCDPIAAVAQIAAVLRSYAITEVWADRYAVGFTESAFREHGIQLKHGTKSRSDLYRELLPALRSRRVRLLDHERMITQFAALERRALPGGGERIDHPAHGNAKDDVSNAVAGALVMSVAVTDPHILTWYRLQSERALGIEQPSPSFGFSFPAEHDPMVTVAVDPARAAALHGVATVMGAGNQMRATMPRSTAQRLGLAS